jgi:aminoethylphosphonate catabolism LysR family transcriptional regulator
LTISFQQLRCFNAVALHGSFTAAARAIFVGQPTITTHVKALEQRFAVELLYRHGHIVELTHTGKKLLAITSEIFQLEAAVEETLQAAGGLFSGQIRISAFDPVQVTGMAALFGEQHPDLSIAITFGNICDLRDTLLEVKADVAVLPSLNDARFHSQPYGRATICLMVGVQHPWAERGTVDIHELEGQRMVTRESGSMQQQVFDKYIESRGVRVNRVLEIDSQDAIREAIALGMGMGILLDVGGFSDPRFKIVEIAGAPMYIDLEIACLLERKEAPVIKAFFALARKMRDASSG